MGPFSWTSRTRKAAENWKDALWILINCVERFSVACRSAYRLRGNESLIADHNSHNNSDYKLEKFFPSCIIYTS